MNSQQLDELLVLNSRRRVILKISGGKSVNTFNELNRLANAFKDVDTLTRRGFSNERLTQRSLNKRAKIISVYVGSPAEVTVLTNWQWVVSLLGVLIVIYKVVADYDKFKRNVPEIYQDATNLTERIYGMSQRQKQRLIQAAREMASDVLLLPESELRKMADKIEHTRRGLLGDNNLPPTLEIIDIDENESSELDEDIEDF